MNLLLFSQAKFKILKSNSKHNKTIKQLNMSYSTNLNNMFLVVTLKLNRFLNINKERLIFKNWKKFSNWMILLRKSWTLLLRKGIIINDCIFNFTTVNVWYEYLEIINHQSKKGSWFASRGWGSVSESG